MQIYCKTQNICLSHSTYNYYKHWCYRFVESYRNLLDKVRQRTVLSVGFDADLEEKVKGIYDKHIVQNKIQ